MTSSKFVFGVGVAKIGSSFYSVINKINKDTGELIESKAINTDGLSEFITTSVAIDTTSIYLASGVKG